LILGISAASNIDGRSSILCGVLELFMEDESFELAGKLSNLGRVVRRLQTLQQGKKSMVRRVGWTGSFQPPGLNRFTCAFATLLGTEPGRPGRATLLAAFAPEGDGGWIFFRGHRLIIRERSPIA
jgi:hypothetical protein